MEIFFIPTELSQVDRVITNLSILHLQVSLEQVNDLAVQALRKLVQFVEHLRTRNGGTPVQSTLFTTRERQPPDSKDFGKPFASVRRRGHQLFISRKEHTNQVVACPHVAVGMSHGLAHPPKGAAVHRNESSSDDAKQQ